MLAQARSFFAERNILEVDTPHLVPRAPLDSNIDVIEAEGGFLHTSPEYAMKRLLAAGAPDIYFLGHVFRKNEIGPRHNPEFTMAEWYRKGISFDAMIQETCAFLFLFLGPLPIRYLSYREAFALYAKDRSTLDPSWDEATQRDYLLTHQIEPHLGRGELTVLLDYPPDQAALACLIEKGGQLVAERFEIYHEGIELTNGYHELTNSAELRKRFEKDNQLRKSQGKEPYRLDEAFLAALNHLPDCCGVSVGFDRAFALMQKKAKLSEVLPFAWPTLLTPPA